MIVDDDADVSSALSQMFSAHGYDVSVAANGAEAIELLDDEGLPCVVLVDLLMPGIVGHELLDYMRATGVTIPVAIISGSPELAPSGYLVFAKPIDHAGLLDFVARSHC